MGGNAFEALVGAIYLDRGYDACMRFMKKRILSEMINIDKVAYREVNFKSKLIEWSQKNRVMLEFKIIEQKKDEQGSPVFRYTVEIEGIAGCEGTGYSKKESQQMASKLTLTRLRKEPQFIDEIFAAKTSRTKMEEEPTAALPQTEERGEERPLQQKEAAAGTHSSADDDNEFDLSNISMKRLGREDIIARAEAMAYAGNETA